MDEVTPSPRAHAIILLAHLLERLSIDLSGQVRMADDVTEIVDAIIAAARAPESDHTRAVEREGRAGTAFDPDVRGVAVKDDRE